MSVASGLPDVALDALPTVTDKLAATAAQYDRSGEFPDAALDVIHGAGLLTAGVSPEFGGPGVGAEGLARILLALGAGDPSAALIASMTIFPFTFVGSRGWRDEVYVRLLEESGRRRVLLNTARVEPELGSPARGGLPATTARRTDAGWEITGRKRFVTGAGGLTHLLVWASTDESQPRVGTFLLDATAPGIEVVRNWNPLGMRASSSHDVTFTEVEIGADDVVDIGPHGPAAQQDNIAGGLVHLLLSSIYLGVARSAQRSFHRFGIERVPANLGKPVATTPRFRQAAGEIEVLLSTTERLILDAATRVDRGEDVPAREMLAAKVVAVRQITAAVTSAVRVLGNPGLSANNPLERHFRDVQTAGVHAPQEDTSLLDIGTAAIGPLA